MKDPANAIYGCTPARFIRAVRAIPPGAGMTGMRGALGETEFEMQQILGYAPIEPDGSFKLVVPADTPIGLAVVNDKGEAFQTHTNWIQVRPGERRTCDGCHSPRRGGAINSGAVANSVPCRDQDTLAAAHQSGETMAATRTRLDANALKLVPDMVFTDFWADTTKPGITARPSITIKYTGNPNPADDLVAPGADQRARQLPDPRRAAVDPQSRRQHVHVVPQRPLQARPERVDRGHRPDAVVQEICSAIRSSTRSRACR